MFNKTNLNMNVSNHVNAVTGNITKTYTKSFFMRFNLKSNLAGRLLSDTPEVYKVHSYSPVQVIQMVMCGDMEVIAELIWQKDYDEMLEGGFNNEI